MPPANVPHTLHAYLAWLHADGAFGGVPRGRSTRLDHRCVRTTGLHTIGRVATDRRLGGRGRCTALRPAPARRRADRGGTVPAVPRRGDPRPDHCGTTRSGGTAGP